MSLPISYLVGLTLATALLLVGCSSDPDPKETQITARVLSPDGRLEAVNAEDLSGGPATGVSEDIYIVQPGRFPRAQDHVLSSECVSNITLQWKSARELDVGYYVASDRLDDFQKRMPDLWWAPWIPKAGPPPGVTVRLERTLWPAGGGC